MSEKLTKYIIDLRLNSNTVLAKYGTEKFTINDLLHNLRNSNPKIFLDTLTLLNVKPAQSVYVGDQILSDIQGSKNVGIIPLLIDRDNVNVDYSETNKINSLHELDNFLSAENNQ